MIIHEGKLKLSSRSLRGFIVHQMRPRINIQSHLSIQRLLTVLIVSHTHTYIHIHTHTAVYFTLGETQLAVAP